MIDLDSTPARYRGTIEVYEASKPAVDWPHQGSPEWRWRCKSRNGQILASGEGYRRKAGALNAIDAMFGAKFWAIYDDEDPQSFVVPWRLVIVDRHYDTTTGAVY
ncbi:YegP family protein [Gordonia terrae]